MKEFQGRTAFVTGAASGIGLAMARTFLDRGMNVMMPDVEQAALDQAFHGLSNYGDRVAKVLVDVSIGEAFAEAANTAYRTFGKVHILCNNAGVSRGGAVEEISTADWEWVVGVNLYGTVHGIRPFLPHMKAHGEDGHIVNTASINGVSGSALAGPYSATKFAVVGMSEVLAAELAETPIGVSVLCPSWVRTRMLDNGRNRPARFGGPIKLDADGGNAERNARYAKALESGLDPGHVAELVICAIETRRLFVFTHAETRAAVERCHELMLQGFDALGDTSRRKAG